MASPLLTVKSDLSQLGKAKSRFLNIDSGFVLCYIDKSDQYFASKVLFFLYCSFILMHLINKEPDKSSNSLNQEVPECA